MLEQRKKKSLLVFSIVAVVLAFSIIKQHENKFLRLEAIQH